MTRPCTCAGRVASSAPDVREVVVRWVDEGQVEHRHRPDGVDDAGYHLNRPVRRFGRYDNMGHFPGLYFFATTGRLVSFESWCERAWAVVMDFDPVVTAVASQPFQLIGRDASSMWHHVPDYWAARAGRPPLVLDVRSEPRCLDDRFVALVASTREVCARMGWDYRLVHDVDAVQFRNIDFLSAYRRPLPDPLGLRPQLLAAAGRGPATIAGLCAAVGDPVVVLPQLFALCWQHRLRFDLSAHLRYYTTEVSIPVRTAMGAGR